MSSRSSISIERCHWSTDKVEIQCNLAAAISAAMYHSEFGRRLQEELRIRHRGNHGALPSSQNSKIQANATTAGGPNHCKRRQHEDAFEQALGRSQIFDEGEDEIAARTPAGVLASPSRHSTSTSSVSARASEHDNPQRHRKGFQGDRYVSLAHIPTSFNLTIFRLLQIHSRKRRYRCTHCISATSQRAKDPKSSEAKDLRS